MKTVKQIALIAMAVAVSAAPALAGTKYATNLVSNSAVDPPGNPTLSPKSQIKLSDKGSISVSLAGVTDGGGMPVTTSTVYADSIKADPTAPNLDGTEYVVIIKLSIAAIAGFIPLVEVPVPVDLNGGKGKTKLSVAGLLGALGPGVGRGIEIQGAEVWGPVGLDGTCSGGTNAGEACLSIDDCPDVTGSCDASCLSVVASAIPAGLPLGPICRGGTQFGMSGLSVPLP